MESDYEHVFSDIENKFEEYRTKEKSKVVLPPLEASPILTSSSSTLSSSSSSSLSPASKKRKVRGSKVIQTVSLLQAPKDDLSYDQKAVLDIALSGRSFFYSGEAGSGKTYLLKRIIAALKNYWGPEAVGVTSSTGVSAVDIGGMTIHSWAGMGLGEGHPTEIVKKMSRMATPRWKKAKVLIIDEISMISGLFFDKLDAVARAMKKTPGTPFGGLQVITCGDFYQLEPVDARTEGNCFQSTVWPEIFKVQVMLTTPFRQLSDPKYGELLNKIRQGTLSQEHIDMLKSRIRKQEEIDNLDGVTKLLPFVDAVQRINNKKLSELPGEQRVFKGTEFHAIGCAGIADLLRKNCRSPDELFLKKDAAVMLVVNKKIEDGLCNGTCGTVKGFSKVGFPMVEFPSLGNRIIEIQPHEWVIRDEKTQRVLAKYTQIPLHLSWAMTIHKSQGATIDNIAVDLNVFGKGQAYVALSRTKTLKGLHINQLPPMDKIIPNPDVTKFYSTVDEIREGSPYLSSCPTQC